jgi:hypothetical protein
VSLSGRASEGPARPSNASLRLFPPSYGQPRRLSDRRDLRFRLTGSQGGADEMVIGVAFQKHRLPPPR